MEALKEWDFGEDPYDIDDFYHQVGEHVIVRGGIHVEHLRLGNPKSVKKETEEIKVMKA